MKPDPRIGLGLCAWVMGDRERAILSWERSLDLVSFTLCTGKLVADKQDPESWVALLLLGLAALNNAREPSSGTANRVESAANGVSYVQRAFKLNNKCSAAALALSTTAGLDGQLPMASKLAERAIQYADTKHHSVLANAERGRLGFVAGDVADAGPFIAAAKAEDGGVNAIAELTLGQIALKNGQSTSLSPCSRADD
jgi:RNA polymerase-associated protein CTR9